jgi:hypothetical protein
MHFRHSNALMDTPSLNLSSYSSAGQNDSLQRYPMHLLINLHLLFALRMRKVDFVTSQSGSRFLHKS